jgi:peroxiredoxin Q/BCP
MPLGPFHLKFAVCINYYSTYRSAKVLRTFKKVERMAVIVQHLQEGGSAPDFELPASGGITVSLNSWRGRNLVIYFYPRDATPGCTVEAEGFSALAGEFASCGTEILGISADSIASHEKFITKNGLAIPLASDESTETLQAYGVWVEKNMYGRKFMGVERTTFLITGDGRIKNIWRKVKIPGHVEEVLVAARALAGVLGGV